jgi:uncharacterized heparinase superfamily protein
MAAEAFLRVRRKATNAYLGAVERSHSTYPSDRDLAKALGSRSIVEIADQIKRRGEPCLTAGLINPAATVQALKNGAPTSIRPIVEDADSITSHRIRLFENTVDLGAQIDWHRDATTGEEWPVNHFTRTPTRIGGGSDVKFVWELSRFYHFVTLGQAYAITADDRYTKEFLSQLSGWYLQNPPSFGINWTVAMEVAIRAVNLIGALELFRASPMLDAGAISLILKTLLSHGRFIRSHLEASYTATSNHYLSDLIGLAVIGLVMPEFNESAGWLKFSLPRLFDEMDKQVLPDGVDYELTTGYHRYVLEVFAILFALMIRQGREIPSRYWDKLAGMFDFVRHYLKPDGTAPLIGDSDDGRLIRFHHRRAVDHSYLMSIAAVLLKDSAFKTSDKIDPEAIWWFGPEARDIYDRLSPSGEPGSKAYLDSQIFVQREGALYAIIDCGDNGALGRGSHSHADALSMEVFAYARTLLRDPGTYVYTASDEWRNRFRSTAYHNTVRVDGQDICQISESRLFSLATNPKTTINAWDVSESRDVLDATHEGYTRLPHPLLHRRRILFDKVREFWTVEDRFETLEGGDSKHSHVFELIFNFDSGLDVSIDAAQRAFGVSEIASIAIVPISGHSFEAEIVERWVSLSYGTKTPSFAIIYRLSSDALFSNTVLLVPYKPGDESRVDIVAAACLAERQ